MKNILFSLLLFVAFNAYSQTYVNTGQQITSTDTLAHELVVRAVFGGSNGQLLYVITDENNSGTIKFSSGELSGSAMYTQYPFPASSRIPITIITGTRNLWYKASAAGQIFTITN